MPDVPDNAAEAVGGDAETIEIPAGPTDGTDQPSLPPVQPPSGAFILQLFLIPMLIVGIVVMVWLTFSWLAHVGSDPHDLVRDLEKLNKGSWQKALTLSNLLRDRNNDLLKDDSALAQDLVKVLESELENARMSPERIKLRFFLCHCLGEFRLADGIPSLVKAARLERDPAEAEVRLAAIASLAKLTVQIGSDRMREHQQVFDVLDEASRIREANPSLQHRNRLPAAAAYALGMIGDAASLERLAQLLIDANPSIRFNAATGLARYGDERAIPVLLQMLDLSNEQALVGTTTPEEHLQQRVFLVKNGIEAGRQYARIAGHGPGVSRFAEALERVIDSNLPTELRLRAKAALLELRE